MATCEDARARISRHLNVMNWGSSLPFAVDLNHNTQLLPATWSLAVQSNNRRRRRWLIRQLGALNPIDRRQWRQHMLQLAREERERERARHKDTHGSLPGGR